MNYYGEHAGVCSVNGLVAFVRREDGRLEESARARNSRQRELKGLTHRTVKPTSLVIMISQLEKLILLQSNLCSVY